MKHSDGTPWTNAQAKEVLALYQRDIDYIARSFARRAERSQGMDLDDLRAEGMVAVLEALSTYQGFGVSERTWVNRRVRARMVDALRRLDRRQRRQEAGPDDATGESTPSSTQPGRLPVSMVSLDASPTVRALTERLRDSRMPPPDDQACATQRRQLLLDAITSLPSRQRTVVEARLLEGRTLRECGDQLCVTEGRAHQLQSLAIKRLRSMVADISRPIATS